MFFRCLSPVFSAQAAPAGPPSAPQPGWAAPASAGRRGPGHLADGPRPPPLGAAPAPPTTANTTLPSHHHHHHPAGPARSPARGRPYRARPGAEPRAGGTAPATRGGGLGRGGRGPSGGRERAGGRGQATGRPRPSDLPPPPPRSAPPAPSRPRLLGWPRGLRQPPPSQAPRPEPRPAEQEPSRPGRPLRRSLPRGAAGPARRRGGSRAGRKATPTACKLRTPMQTHLLRPRGPAAAAPAGGLRRAWLRSALPRPPAERPG